MTLRSPKGLSPIKFRNLLEKLRLIGDAGLFRNSVVICAVFRNEAGHLDEWLDFHQKAGASKVVLYDDASIDGYQDVLDPWIAQGFVELRRLTVRNQLWAYNDCLRRHRWNYRWFAFIDVDEFLFPGTDSRLPEVLNRYTRWAGVFVFWELFGANGHEDTVVSNILRSNTASLPLPKTVAEKKSIQVRYRAAKGSSEMTGRPFQGKTIAQGWRTWKMGNHFPDLCIGSVVDEQRRIIPRKLSNLPLAYLPTNQELKLNHYWAKSRSHLVARASRKNLSGAAPAAINQYLAWEAELNVATNLSAVNYRNQRFQPFVFIIGFNKTGTRSLHKFFLDNGFPSIHWGEGQIALAMKGNKARGWPILTGFDLKYRVFSDLTHVEDTFYCEGNKWFRELDRDYPGSYFILNTRPLEAWLLSRERHERGKFLQKHMNIRGTSSKEATIAAWAQEREDFHAEVRAYFSPNNRFLEVDIESEDAAVQISNLLGFTPNPQTWKRRGRTQGNH